MNKLLILIFVIFTAFSEIKFDDNVGEDEWAAADKHTIDYEIAPSYNAAAEHLTEVSLHMMRIYLRCFQSIWQPGHIRANIRSRDGIAWQNDHVIVGIDIWRWSLLHWLWSQSFGKHLRF